jgi:hypothetical protein
MKGLGALDLGDGAVEVLEDLFEDLSIARERRGRPAQVTEVGRRLANVLEVGAAAEDASLAADDDGAQRFVAGERQSRFSEVARGLDVEGVEALAAVDGNDPHRS